MPETFDLKALEKRMDGALAALKQEFTGLRTGRASIHLLDTIQVMAYGANMPLNQVASVSAVDARMLSVSVWDKSLVGATDRAIREAPLGLNPITDGQTLRIPIPPLSEERRKELQKLAGQFAEHARVAVRNIRRDGMDQIKKAKGAGMPEDDQKMWHDEVQDLTDKAIAAVDKTLQAKQAEIMQV